MIMNELKMTEIETLSWFELERVVNDLKKNHTKKGLMDLETKILKGIFEDKKYADLAEEISREEQSIKNAAYSLFKILSEQTGEKIGSKNLITALARYRDNSQIFDHNNKPQPQQSDKVFELVIEVDIDDLTPENNDKIISFLQETARDNTIKPIMKLKGSIRLFLEGSEDGLQRLADLHQSGELQALLNELKSDDIPEIIVKKAEFTTDAKVIEKAELIKAIREGTIDKTTLQQVDLSGAFLIGADLRGAILSKAILSGAILSKANLIGANLSVAILSGAILSGANLSRAILSGANLIGANLSGANLIGANLSGANLIGANLSDADLIGANLSDANLSDADLRGANLSGAEVENAIFTNATGITPEQKQDLIRRGAIFGDTSNDRSKALV
ncbi:MULTISPECIES: pentapeptide repeat-containing protein [unclassified Microcystis]|uniref:pentapeptide repeat-containing protein n=1 Tax=unclassified Microcystis TaxID=2643300 RepID=UPI00119176D9|nr:MULTISPECIES: pentapeptide repeat-containing protein [unclassified Microcystis]MCA2928565.1 pentapeptide repeat-containing protein [Microcystis sp. M020S1]MCA2936535.1 pentapeptide repeat-containing protein [Microcystis sp. M015S1]MCA2620657.1 pentapeptide repeat-containing protein [Microcystis sp. M099S2]MCA2679953.1 pentapeptide repeat-containing protein [Microcystis sp. M043S2]MCA2698003.1 pentapeptide repeat-containing protein [Microcystis sp. M040S2]